MGHRTKFRNKNKCLLHVLLQVRVNLHQPLCFVFLAVLIINNCFEGKKETNITLRLLRQICCYSLLHFSNWRFSSTPPGPELKTSKLFSDFHCFHSLFSFAVFIRPKTVNFSNKNLALFLNLNNGNKNRRNIFLHNKPYGPYTISLNSL